MSWPEAIAETAMWISIPATFTGVLWGFSKIIKVVMEGSKED